MLVLTRKLGESIVIGDDIRVTVSQVDGSSIRLAIEAPEEVPVHRQEVYDAKKAERQPAAIPQVTNA